LVFSHYQRLDYKTIAKGDLFSFLKDVDNGSVIRNLSNRRLKYEYFLYK